MISGDQYSSKSEIERRKQETEINSTIEETKEGNFFESYFLSVLQYWDLELFLKYYLDR